MELRQAFVLRDEMNKQALIDVIGSDDPEFLDKLDNAFETGNLLWQQQLIDVFGERDAADLRELLGRNVMQPKG